MAVKIRLSRGGAKKRPHYRIVAADIRAPRDGRFIEKLGTWDPLLPKDHAGRVTLNAERIKHWLDNGAKPTDRVARFLDDAGLLTRTPGNNPQKAKPRKKTQERLEAEQARKEAAAAEAAAPAAPAAPDTPDVTPEDKPEDKPEEAVKEEATGEEEGEVKSEAKSEAGDNETEGGQESGQENKEEGKEGKDEPESDKE